MSFWKDVNKFGSGLLDSVGEGIDDLIKVAASKDSSKNAGTTQQPNQPVKDKHGNAITGALPPQTINKTWLYVGGGLGIALLLTTLLVTTKK